jgi:hypothetical protein
VSLGRLLLVLLILAGGLWLAQTQHLFGPAADPADQGTAAPADRARAAARASAARNAQTDAASRSLDSQAAAAPAGAVTENMTREQVRALLGPADSVETESSESGAGREKWTYRNPGKIVVFENGVVVRID